MQIRVCVFEVSVYMYTSLEDVARDGSGNGRVPSRGNNMSEDREVEMLVGGGGGLDYGMKIDQNVSVDTVEQKRDEKHQGERDGKRSEKHIDGDEGLG